MLSHHIGESASSKVMSGGMVPSSTALTDVFASLLWVIFVCDFTLPMCVRSLLWSLSLSSWSVSCRRSL